MSQPLSLIEISRKALRHNVQQFRTLVGDHQQLVAVVKANAYGHGMEQVVPAIEDLVDAFQIDDIEELRELRQLTNRRTLVLGYVAPDDIAEAISLDAELAVFDTERLPLLKGARVHLKIDALLGRLGIRVEALPAFLEELRRHPSIHLAGVYGHFANIEDTEDTSHAIAQISEFEDAMSLIRAAGFSDLVTHMSATSGILRVEGTESNRGLVRPGIGLYGLYPSDHLAKEFAELDLRPALTWKTRLAQVKLLPAGHPVGYGLSYVTDRPTQIGVVPQGYSDGLPRSLSNSGTMFVNGVPCPIIGRVAMNMCMLDLSNCTEAKAGDEVIIIGPSISAEKVADDSQTINYEIVSRISPKLPRYLIDF
ncbi:alanine racemase [soil metagenome]